MDYRGGVATRRRVYVEGCKKASSMWLTMNAKW